MFPGEPTLQGGKPMTRIAVIGGGAWGTALADLLVRKGGLESVTLWAREPEVVEHVNRDHLNPVFLPGAGLAPALRARGDVAETVRGADVVVSAAPCHAVRDVMARAAAGVGRGAVVVSVSKGLEPERLNTMSCVLGEVLPKTAKIAVLSGPSFAQEVYARQPRSSRGGSPRSRGWAWRSGRSPRRSPASPGWATSCSPPPGRCRAITSSASTWDSASDWKTRSPDGPRSRRA